MLSVLKSSLAGSLALVPRAATRGMRWETLRGSWTAWRRERDVRAIERALGRLSDRQLAMVGMSRTSIESDVSDLIDRTEAGRTIANDVLRLVDHARPRVPLLQHAA
jgi:uncharacterized protein YjiS (DUF1127 family)